MDIRCVLCCGVNKACYRVYHDRKQKLEQDLLNTTLYMHFIFPLNVAKVPVNFMPHNGNVHAYGYDYTGMHTFSILVLSFFLPLDLTTSGIKRIQLQCLGVIVSGLASWSDWSRKIRCQIQRTPVIVHLINLVSFLCA